MASTLELNTIEGMLAYLRQSGYPSTNKVECLSSSHGGFVFRAHFTENSTTRTIIAKHSRDNAFTLMGHDLNLEATRLIYENAGLELLSDPKKLNFNGRVHAPRAIQYDSQAQVLLEEDGGAVPTLKGWCIPGADVARASRMGKALGRFLANFHDVTAEKAELKELFQRNVRGRETSASVVYGMLSHVVASHGMKTEFLGEDARAASSEILNASDVLTIGDFWTGNVLVPSHGEAPVTEGGADGMDEELIVIDFELMKPGTAEFDIGQMAAELFFLKRFGDEAAGSALLTEFLRSYRLARKGTYEPIKVASRVGAHLIVVVAWVFMAQVGEERGRAVMEIGRDLLSAVHMRNDQAIRDSFLGLLYGES